MQERVQDRRGISNETALTLTLSRPTGEGTARFARHNFQSDWIRPPTENDSPSPIEWERAGVRASVPQNPKLFLQEYALRMPLPVRSVLKHSRWDALFIALAVVHGLAMIGFPSIPLIAIGMWWNANTIAHNFIHRPFFRSRTLNVIFSAVESVVLGIPQRLWRDRHLAHHANRPWRWRWSRQLAWETALVLLLGCGLLAGAPEFFLTVYLPGWVIGLALCQLQ